MNGGSVPSASAGGDLLRGGGGVAVLLLVGAVAVAVLEVDAEVLDRPRGAASRARARSTLAASSPRMPIASANVAASGA